jgi:hypothetical protein
VTAGRRWRFVDQGADEPLDVLIVDPLVSFAHPQVQQALRSGHPALVGYRRSQLQTKVNVLTLSSPVRPSDYEQLLDSLGERLDGANERRSRRRDEVADERLPAQSTLQANQEASLVQAIGTLLLEGVGVFGLELRGKTQVVAFLPEEQFVLVGDAVADIGELTARLRSATDAWRWRELADDEWFEIAAAGPRHPLSTLRWCAGLAMPEGKLHPEISEHLAFKLVRWPDFGAIGGSPAGFRLASMLTRTPRTLVELADAVGGRRDEVIAFLNACHAGELLVQTQPPAGLDARRTARPQRIAIGLIGRLRRALGIGDMR